MALRPTVDDLVRWAGINQPDAQGLSAMTECMAAALDVVEARITLPDAYTSTTPDETAYPQEVRAAVLLTAARLSKRRQSPEGVAGFGEFGVVRISTLDPDVEQLIARYLTLDGFY